MNTVMRVFFMAMLLATMIYQLGCSLPMPDSINVTLVEFIENDDHPAIRLRAENLTYAAVANLVCDVMAYRDETIVNAKFAIVDRFTSVC